MRIRIVLIAIIVLVNGFACGGEGAAPTSTSTPTPTVPPTATPSATPTAYPISWEFPLWSEVIGEIRDLLLEDVTLSSIMQNGSQIVICGKTNNLTHFGEYAESLRGSDYFTIGGFECSDSCTGGECNFSIRLTLKKDYSSYVDGACILWALDHYSVRYGISDAIQNTSVELMYIGGKTTDTTIIGDNTYVADCYHVMVSINLSAGDTLTQIRGFLGQMEELKEDVWLMSYGANTTFVWKIENLSLSFIKDVKEMEDINTGSLGADWIRDNYGVIGSFWRLKFDVMSLYTNVEDVKQYMVTMTTDHIEYEQGEDVLFTIENHTNCEVLFPSSNCYEIQRYNGHSWESIPRVCLPCFGFPGSSSLLLQPGEAETLEWDQKKSWCSEESVREFSHIIREQAASGTYRVEMYFRDTSMNYLADNLHIYSNEFTVK